MPDDRDYLDFSEFLKRAASWTATERATAESRLHEQRNMLAAAHPRDANGRARLAAVVEEIEDAIRRYDTR